MTSPNGLICFTNCLLPQEDGSLIHKDLWIDERCGVILDSQRTFFLRKERPDRVIDLGGNILRCVYASPIVCYSILSAGDNSPGFIDIQINGAYNFDFSIYEGDDEAYRTGLRTVAEKIVETGVTS